jgi:Do/DeqQ family serine protease
MNISSATVQRSRRAAGAATIGLLATFVLALAGCADIGSSAGASSPARSDVVGGRELENSAPASYSAAVSRAAPAVVRIRAERRVRPPEQYRFHDGPSFPDLAGAPGRAPQEGTTPRESGLGSGVVVSPDGYILTGHHVVDGAEDIKVDFGDKRTLGARVVGTDPPSDLAVLKVEADGLPALALGDSDDLAVGDVVLALGSPLGMRQTVTMGVVSAKGRSTGLSDGTFEDFLQTDAEINRGNAGGALVSVSGELVGINSRIVSPSGAGTGVGFAVPSNMARAVMEQLVVAGRVRRGVLGVVVQTVTSDIAASLGLGDARGVIVSSVRGGSAADRAGLRRGDVITSLDGVPLEDGNVLRNRVAVAPPGTEVTVAVLRDGREEQLRATLDELPGGRSRSAERNDPPDANEGEGRRLGLRVEPLTPELVARLGLGSAQPGLVIVEVDPAGPAAGADLRPGDVIEEADRERVTGIEDLRGALRSLGERPLLLLINRGGQTIFAPVRPRP